MLRGVLIYVFVTNMSYETVCASFGCANMLRDIFGSVLFGTFKYSSVLVGTFYKVSLHSFGRGNMLRVIFVSVLFGTFKYL